MALGSKSLKSPNPDDKNWRFSAQVRQRKSFRIVHPDTAGLDIGSREILLRSLWNGHCKHDEATIANALIGTWRKEHLFYQQLFVEVEKEIVAFFVIILVWPQLPEMWNSSRFTTAPVLENRSKEIY